MSLLLALTASGGITPVVPATVNGGGFFEYPMRRRPREELEETEPAIAQEIKTLALKAARSDERALSADQVQAHLNSIGLAYEHAYQDIYLGLIQEIEQEREMEAIATCMAALL